MHRILTLSPAFLLYCIIVLVFAIVMIYRIAPLHGKKNPLIYISICSTVGSVSIMAVKGFGVALKLTFGGNNQLTHPSTYAFAVVVVVCIMTQMNYFNKALATFSTNIVNPLYYVTFTTATLCASFLLFGGFNTTDTVNTISLLCGFLVIFTGVYLLNLSRDDPEGSKFSRQSGVVANGVIYDEAVPTDGLSAFTSRRSMQARRSSIEAEMAGHHRYGAHSRQASGGSISGDRAGLMNDYDIEANGAPGSPHASRTPPNGSRNSFGLEELAEDDDEEEEGKEKRVSFEDEHGNRVLKQGGTPLARLSGSGRRVETQGLRMGGKG